MRGVGGGEEYRVEGAVNAREEKHVVWSVTVSCGSAVVVARSRCHMSLSYGGCS